MQLFFKGNPTKLCSIKLAFLSNQGGIQLKNRFLHLIPLRLKCPRKSKGKDAGEFTAHQSCSSFWGGLKNFDITPEVPFESAKTDPLSGGLEFKKLLCFLHLFKRSILPKPPLGNAKLTLLVLRENRKRQHNNLGKIGFFRLTARKLIINHRLSLPEHIEIFTRLKEVQSQFLIHFGIQVKRSWYLATCNCRTW